MSKIKLYIDSESHALESKNPKNIETAIFLKLCYNLDIDTTIINYKSSLNTGPYPILLVNNKIIKRNDIIPFLQQKSALEKLSENNFDCNFYKIENQIKNIHDFLINFQNLAFLPKIKEIAFETFYKTNRVNVQATLKSIAEHLEGKKYLFGKFLTSFDISLAAFVIAYEKFSKIQLEIPKSILKLTFNIKQLYFSEKVLEKSLIYDSVDSILIKEKEKTRIKKEKKLLVKKSSVFIRRLALATVVFLFVVVAVTSNYDENAENKNEEK